MITNKILPAHVLRLYLWEVLKLNTDLTTINIPDLGNTIPIIPLSDERLVASSGKPYLIYGYSETESGPERRGGLALRVIAPTFAQLGQITNVIGDLFEQSDSSAEAVNRWSSTIEQLVGISFTYTKTTYIDSGTPPDEEGEDIEGLVNIDYRYKKHIEVALPPASNGGLWA